MSRERKVTERDKAALARRGARTEAHAEELKRRGLVIDFKRIAWKRRTNGKAHVLWSLRLSSTGEVFAEAYRKEQAR